MRRTFRRFAQRRDCRQYDTTGKAPLLTAAAGCCCLLLFAVCSFICWFPCCCALNMLPSVPRTCNIFAPCLPMTHCSRRPRWSGTLFFPRTLTRATRRTSARLTRSTSFMSHSCVCVSAWLCVGCEWSADEHEVTDHDSTCVLKHCGLRKPSTTNLEHHTHTYAPPPTPRWSKPRRHLTAVTTQSPRLTPRAPVQCPGSWAVSEVLTTAQLAANGASCPSRYRPTSAVDLWSAAVAMVRVLKRPCGAIGCVGMHFGMTSSSASRSGTTLP